MNSLGLLFPMAVISMTASTLISQTYSKQFVLPPTIANAPVVPLGVGDLNGDGRPDIVYTASVLLQNANGTFRNLATSYTLTHAAKLVDVNHDRKLDIVDSIPGQESCDYQPDGTVYCDLLSDPTFNVYVGNGDGTFKPAVVLDLGPEGSGNASLAVLDLNGDGAPDASVNFTGDPLDSASRTGFVLLNNGSGTFKPSGSSLPTIEASGDFNHDGHTDLIVAGGSASEVLLGDGHGKFTVGADLPNLGGPAVAVGDFDHDGNLDVAAAPSIYPPTGVYVAFGNGKGQFTNAKKISSLYTDTLSAVDMNHDGYLDLVAGSVSIAVFTNHKNRSFSDPRVYAGQVSRSYGFTPAIVVADVNRDGNVDILHHQLILYGQASGQLVAPVQTLSTNAGVVASDDLNHDGVPDIVVTNTTYQTVSVFTGTGKGYFNPGVKYATGISAAAVAIGDVNGDGVPDLVVTRNSLGSQNAPPTPGATDLAVLLGNSDGTFRNAIRSSTLGAYLDYTFNTQTYLVDVNHDGKTDLIGDWGTALGNGDGTFRKAAAFPAAIQRAAGIGIGDFNRDGNVDIAVGVYGTDGFKAPTPSIFTLLGDGSGTFTISHQETLPGNDTTINAFTVADMDDDGKPDLIYAYQSGPTAQVAIELGNGDGTFHRSGSVVFSSGLEYASLLIGDFNRDGHTDVVLLESTYAALGPYTDSVSLVGDGAGNLEAPQHIPVQSYNGTVINLNNDNAPDIVATGVDSLGFQRLINTGAH
jgi:hypothetical protein